MKKSSPYLIEAIRFLIILLWVYASVSKLAEFDHFKKEMAIQTIPALLSGSLVYLLPAAELSAAALLFIHSTLRHGLYASLILMLVFTGYIGLVLANYFGRTPCSCGGVLSRLNWNMHFIFNLFVLLLILSGIYLTDRERREGRGS